MSEPLIDGILAGPTMPVSDNAKESYIEGLKYELAGAIQHGDKDHEKAVKAELDRATGKKVEKAVAPKTTETRAK